MPCSRSSRIPRQLAELRADPSLMPTAVEELLRYDSPVERTITRWAAADVELGGETIARGDLVIAVVGSANRDAAQFADPATLDLGRDDGEARRLRARTPLLPRRAARAARDGDRAAKHCSPPPESPARDRRGRSLLASDPDLPQPRVAAGRLGRLSLAGNRRRAAGVRGAMRSVSTLALVAVIAAGGGNGAAKEEQPVLAYASDAPGSLDLFVIGIGDASPRRIAASRARRLLAELVAGRPAGSPTASTPRAVTSARSGSCAPTAQARATSPGHHVSRSGRPRSHRTGHADRVLLGHRRRRRLGHARRRDAVAET